MRHGKPSATTLHLGTFSFEVNRTALEDPYARGLNPQLMLNGNPINDTRYDQLWTDVRELPRAQDRPVEVSLTLGGPMRGDLTEFMTSEPYGPFWSRTFNQLYAVLKEALENLPVDGVDIFNDHFHGLPAFNATQLVDALRTDFGDRLTITLSWTPTSPRATDEFNALEGAKRKMDRQIIRGGALIDGWLDTAVQATKVPHSKLVFGLNTRLLQHQTGFEGPQANTKEKINETVRSLLSRYPQLGGVAGWEYAGSGPSPSEPWRWAERCPRPSG